MKKISNAVLLLVCQLLFFISSCSLFFNDLPAPKEEIPVDSINLSFRQLDVSVGGMEYIGVSIKPVSSQKDITVTWSGYDTSIIECSSSDNFGAVIVGKKAGNTSLRVSAGGMSATCIVTVSGVDPTHTEDPYIYSNYNVLELNPGITQRVHVSLFGGDAGDIDGFSWTTDKPDIITLSPQGQYCMISAKHEGSAKITITHPRSTYAYNMYAYVFAESMTSTYITTTNNIVTINRADGDKTISVDVKNPIGADYASQFSWDIISEDAEPCISLSSNRETAVITPKKSGSAFIRVSHPESAYPLDILVRVITIVENIVIEPSKTLITISGSESQTITAKVTGLPAGKTYSPDEFSWTVESPEYVEYMDYGNEIILSGKSNGATKVIVSHDLAPYSREIMVLVRDQESQAIDASTYITTSQNYIRTKVGADPTDINIMLYGGNMGDERNFTWEVDNPSVVEMETTDGTILASRAAATYAFGTAHLTPKSEGTAIITISHPKSLYSTEILVKVLSVNALLEPPLHISSSASILTMLNGTTTTLTASLLGNKTFSDDTKITWKKSDDRITVTGNATQANVTANGPGSGMSNIMINHPRAEVPKKVIVLTADTQEELDNMKALYADKTHFNVTVGNTAALILNEYGLTQEEYDSILWTSNNTRIATVESIGSSTGMLTAHAVGETTITARVPNSSINQVEFTISVYPFGTDPGELPKEVYFTTRQNVVVIPASGQSKDISISAIGLENSDKHDIVWNVENPNIISVSANGETGTLTALKEGETIVSISHPESQNMLHIVCRVGKEDTNVMKALYANKTHVNLIAKDTTTLLLNEYGLTQDEYESIVWTSSNTRIATVESAGTLTGILTAHTSGDTTVTAKVPNSSINQVVFTVSVYPFGTDPGKLPKEVYFTTRQNVVVIPVSGQSKDVSINAIGLENAQKHNITWDVENSEIISISANGESGTFTALKHGETTILISHPESENTLRIICRVGKEDTNGMKALYADKTHFNVIAGNTATLILNEYGLTQDEYDSIMWTSNNTRIATVDSVGTLTGILSAHAVGETTVTARVPGSSINQVDFTISVYPSGTDIGDITKEVYLTTRQNVVVIPASGQAREVLVSAVGLENSKKHNIIWNAETSGIISISANGESGTFTALKEGETIVSISHPDSQNTLRITCRVGKEFVHNNPKIPYISASTEIISMVKGTDDFMLQALLIDGENPESGFSFSIDKTSIASVTSSFSSGKCFIKPIEAGQAELIISHPESQFDKKVLIVVANTQEELEGYKYLTTAQNVITVGEGNRRTVTVSIQNSDQVFVNGYTWESSSPAIVGVTASGASAVFTGNGIGTAIIRVRHNECQYPLEIIAICVDPIATANNPYITTPSPILTLTVSTNWTTINAELVGGKSEDNANFSWMVENSNIAQLYGQGQSARVRAVSSGVTYVNVNHPKAQYPMRMLLICDEAITTNCHISVPESIINMKPTDSAKTINATLVNGSAEDKYDFTWYCDTYDVVELNYSANIASIRPLTQGETTIHIKHPKAAYEQKIIVKVSEYTTFGFGSTSKTITQGTVSFLSMQIPVSAMETHVEYSSNAEQVVTVTGTKHVSQLTGIGEGTAVVTAKLVATASNTIQATSEILVYCRKADATLTYITTSSTTFTLEKNMTRTLNADIIGPDINPTDVRNLQWKSSDPNIIKISGVSTTGIATGNQVIVQAVNSGECTITITHEKSNSPLVMYFIVPGIEKQEISLNKTFITVETGSSVEVKASITNGQTADYKAIVWDLAKVNDTAIGSIMGSGPTVSIYAQKPGRTKVRATLPNGNYAECDVLIEAARSLSFLTQTLRLQPGESKSFTYTMSPADAEITWYRNEDTYFDFQVNTVNQTVTITGKKEGTSTLTGITNYGNKASINIYVAWDYNFQIGKSMINAEPEYDSSIPDKFIIPYTVNPVNAKIVVNLNNDAIATYVIDQNKKQIILTPIGEGTGKLTVEARNPDDDNRVFATRICELNFKYQKVTLVPTIVSQTGSFSNYNKDLNMLTIGDGETVRMGFSIAEKNVNYQIKSVSFVKQDQTSPIMISATGSDNIKNIEHPNDQIVLEFLLTNDTYYTYNDERITISWYKIRDAHTWSSDGETCFVGFVDPSTTTNIYSRSEWRVANGIFYLYDGFKTTGVVKQVVPFENPKRVSIENFMANTDWYVPERIVTIENKGSGTNYTYYYPGEYFINNTAELVPILDTDLISSNTSGYVQVEILRSGLSEVFQIPVITETRNCAFNLVP